MIRDLCASSRATSSLPWRTTSTRTPLPSDVWDQIGSGLPGIPFSEEVGGSEGGTPAYALAVEELAKVCGSTALTYAAHVSPAPTPLTLG